MWPFNFKYPHTEYHARQENSEYPHTDYHIIDLDWFVEQIKSLWDYIAEHIVEFPLSIGKGGTGATNTESARTNLGLGALATLDRANISHGGTGANTASGARTNLGLGAVATENVVPITKGGTGGTTALEARQNLGIEETTVSFPITLDKGGTGIEAESLSELYNQLAVFALGSVEYLSAGTDLNEVTTAGNYFAPSDCLHLPITGQSCRIIVISAINNVNAKQISLGNNVCYMRTHTGFTRWGNWQRVNIGTTSIEDGGTGATTAAAARQNLGIMDAVYPVGSIYMSVNSTSPATLFGGTWEQIKDKFLLSAGDSYTAGNTGGEATHTLTVDEIPAHDHTTTMYGIGTAGNGTGTAYQTYMNLVGTQDATSSEKGGSQAHNNMPPYLVVYVWKRTA